MARWRGTLMIGGLLAAFVLAPSVCAADGRVAFTGMIVEPTCAVSAGDMASLVSGTDSTGTAALHRSCSRTQAGIDTGSRFGLAVSVLSAGRQGDQLLSYFAGNAQASGMAARLVTQTYE